MMIEFPKLNDASIVDEVIALTDDRFQEFLDGFRRSLRAYRLKGVTRIRAVPMNDTAYEADYIRVNDHLSDTPWEDFGPADAVMLLQNLGCVSDLEVISALPELAELTLRADRYVFYFGFMTAHFAALACDAAAFQKRYPDPVRRALFTFFELVLKKYADEPRCDDVARLRRLLAAWPVAPDSARA